MVAFFLRIWNDIWNFILNILFPLECLGCEKDGKPLCDSCRLSIRNVAGQVCGFCYKMSDGGFTCINCKRRGVFLDGLLVMQNYDLCPLLAKAIHSFKYDFLHELAKPLALELQAFFLKEFQASYYDGFWEAEIVFCPIPLFHRRQQTRGFNQSSLLLQYFKDFPVQELLTRVHFHRPQKELNKSERAKNILGAFEVTNLAREFYEPGKAFVILVDDVATTLATLEEAAKALKKAGFPLVTSLVLARKY